jgi:pantoate--beta-alanine ligase
VEIFKTIAEIREFVSSKRQAGAEIGFVPTMGYLHEGHLSLMSTAEEENDVVVASIFVNPTQFGPGEDYEEYPRDLERDADYAANVGVDAIFAPDVNEMYNPDHATKFELAGITEKLCGASRPGHFSGVCTIVTKLFNIINPDRAYFGQKDAQQVLVIKKLVAELNFNLEIRTVPIVREEDGLAVSSRNKNLQKEERKAATVLYESLQLAQAEIEAGTRDTAVIKEKMTNLIEQEALAEIDYIELVDQNSLEELARVKGKILIAIAVYIGDIRLIDNLMMEVQV